jgi:hypothetical protein
MTDADDKPSFTAGCFMFVFGGIMMVVGGSMSEMGMGFFGTIISIGGILFLLGACWHVWRRIAGFFRK